MLATEAATPNTGGGFSHACGFASRGLEPPRWGRVAQPGRRGSWRAHEFLPPDGKSATGVWQSLTLDAGPFRSVDGFAKNYTQWPDSGNAGAAIVDEAKDCLK